MEYMATCKPFAHIHIMETNQADIIIRINIFPLNIIDSNLLSKKKKKIELFDHVN